MKLNEIVLIKGRITLKTGLHIGAGDTEMHIGGTDNPVIKHPHTNDPYIPGSSIKGKVRSLLELQSGLMGETKGQPLSLKVLESKMSESDTQLTKNILRLFGTSGADSDAKAEIGIARASFSDCSLNKERRHEIIKNQFPLTEVKAENTIDRISGTAKNPRFTERVVAGLIFDLNISFKVMAEDKKDGKNELLGLLMKGLKLLENDALGGSGSRGYGRISITFDKDEHQRLFEASAN
jgi:CRISPR-associated protein Csm3